MWILITTGIRLSEMADLVLTDLDFEGNRVRIRHGKGGKERWVPLLPQAKKAVSRFLAHRKDRCPQLWLSEERLPIKAKGLEVDLIRAQRRVGFRVKDAVHVFRRTWAANAVRQGIPRPYILAVAGWSSGAMLDTYTAAMIEEEAAFEAFKEFRPLG